MTKSAKSILFGAIRSGDFSSATNTLKVLSDVSDDKESLNKDEVIEVANYISKMEEKLHRTQRLLQRFQQKADNNIPRIKMLLDNSIYDGNSALKALETYDSDWFKNLVVSTNSIVELASLIKDKCLSFGITNTLWEQLANRDPETINNIQG